MAIDIDVLHQELDSRISIEIRSVVDMKTVGESGLQIKIDGEKCLTSIGVWPNGCCDVDYLYVQSERGIFAHYEFAKTADAIEPILNEIGIAIERAG